MYSIVLKARDGTHISDDQDIETLREAKQRARQMLEDLWAETTGTTHEDLGTHKVEVINDAGEIIFDKFRPDVGG